jgi:small subunit ribosomal protein S1
MPRKKITEATESNEADNIEAENPVVEDMEIEKNGGQAETRARAAPVLTIESGGEIENAEHKDDLIWHSIQNAYRAHRILSGVMTGVEKTETGSTVTVVDYRGLRVVIPIDEAITINLSGIGGDYGDTELRKSKIIGNMLGTEIDFIVKGIDSRSRSVVASRKEAMIRKRQLFYFDPDSSGKPKIYVGRIVQARVIAVSEHVIRIEIFGAECSVLLRDLSWEWIGDAQEHFSIGGEILAKVTAVNGSSPEDLTVKASVKEALPDTRAENLKKCREQGKYVGKIIGIHKGTYFIRLGVGVNAVAHSTQETRKMAKKDKVSFVVTKFDEAEKAAVGIITKLLQQHV